MSLVMCLTPNLPVGKLFLKEGDPRTCLLCYFVAEGGKNYTVQGECVESLMRRVGHKVRGGGGRIQFRSNYWMRPWQ